MLRIFNISQNNGLDEKIVFDEYQIYKEDAPIVSVKQIEALDSVNSVDDVLEGADVIDHILEGSDVIDLHWICRYQMTQNLFRQL